ncbi:GmrSD restriction endonuclease domain-containing protein [Arthrobacter sp. CP30]
MSTRTRELSSNSSAVRTPALLSRSSIQWPWQKGVQQLSAEQRLQFANDPLNLLAVDGPANMAKGDGDAATWLPPN